MSGQTIEFQYKFFLPGNRVQEFQIRLNEETLEMVPPNGDPCPEWVRLSYHQCPNCPFTEADRPECPIARNLIGIMDFARGSLSYETVDVEITSQERIYRKQTSLQNALGSLIGIYMTTSGCTVMDKLRPLVRTHLPFATMPETTYRWISMYLLAQYFLKKRGLEPDWELKNLTRVFDDIQIVNEHFLKRIQGVHQEDAGLNAIVHLSCYAWFSSQSLVDRGLTEIERFFQAYFNAYET